MPSKKKEETMTPDDALMNEIMAEMGFDPYKGKYGEGWFRYIRAIKGGLLGEVGSYYLHDYILVKYPSKEDIISMLAPVDGVMTQRIALVSDHWDKKHFSKSFWLGFKGFAEVAYISPHEEGKYAPRKFRDLSYIWYVAKTAYAKHRGLDNI
jgi:hypothetical protein